LWTLAIQFLRGSGPLDSHRIDAYGVAQWLRVCWKDLETVYTSSIVALVGNILIVTPIYSSSFLQYNAHKLTLIPATGAK